MLRSSSYRPLSNSCGRAPGTPVPGARSDAHAGRRTAVKAEPAASRTALLFRHTYAEAGVGVPQPQPDADSARRSQQESSLIQFAFVHRDRTYFERARDEHRVVQPTPTPSARSSQTFQLRHRALRRAGQSLHVAASSTERHICRSASQPSVTFGSVATLRLHDLRHTAVALWITAGASPKELAVRAGHTSVSVVLDRYGHLLPGHEDKVNDALDVLARGAEIGASTAPISTLTREERAKVG
jgi:hypothetical protein